MTLRQLLLAAALASASPCWAGIVAREWSYHAKPPSGMTRVELHFKDVTTKGKKGRKVKRSDPSV